MSVVSLLQRQVESRAQLICQQRNQSVPAELGKASYEVTPTVWCLLKNTSYSTPLIENF